MKILVKVQVKKSINFFDTGHSRFAYKKEDIRKNDLLSKSQEFKSYLFSKS